MHHSRHLVNEFKKKQFIEFFHKSNNLYSIIFYKINAKILPIEPAVQREFSGKISSDFS